MEKKVRGLNSREQHELIYALALARSRNDKKVSECLNEANLCAEDERIYDDYVAEANRYEEWAELDSDLIEAIRLGAVVILVQDEED
jgi:hypothetical protein